MSEPENFFSRWWRLKRDPALADNSVEPHPQAEELPLVDVPALPPLDLTSLPAIESIGADSDIRQFLQAGVPAELTRAALRSAWTADPAIRGFIGIADNQWDFNGEGAIPGFGALAAEDREVNLLALAQRSLGPSSAGTLESVDPAHPPVSTRIDPRTSGAVDRFLPVDASPSRSLRVAETDDLAGDISIENHSDDPAEIVETSAGGQIRRSHGGALPR